MGMGMGMGVNFQYLMSMGTGIGVIFENEYGCRYSSTAPLPFLRTMLSNLSILVFWGMRTWCCGTFHFKIFCWPCVHLDNHLLRLQMAKGDHIKGSKKRERCDFICIYIIYQYGVPRYIITDNGKPFVNKLMIGLYEWLSLLNTNHPCIMKLLMV